MCPDSFICTIHVGHDSSSVGGGETLSAEDTAPL